MSTPRLRITDSRRYRQLWHALTGVLLSLFLTLAFSANPAALVLPVVAFFLLRFLRAANPSGYLLELSAPVAGAPRAWQVWKPAGGHARYALHNRSRLTQMLWLEVRPVPVHPARAHRIFRGGGRRRPALRLLVFADAMSDGDWRRLRRALRLAEGRDNVAG